MNKEEQIARLTLLLLYLTSWEEKNFKAPAHRAWKGYDFYVLNKLEKEGLISQNKTAKSVYLTKQGIEAAKKLEEELSILFLNNCCRIKQAASRTSLSPFCSINP